MRTFCEIIRGLREDRDLKQSDVAAILGTSQQYYSKYETGKYEMPVRCILILADFYGVSTDYLLGRTDAPAPVSDYKKPLPGGGTLDRLYADLLSLGPDGCRAVREYVELQKRARRP